MLLYPENIEQKLGFDVLREWLEERMLSLAGSEALDSEEASSDPGWVAEELGAVFEMQQALRFDDPVPLEAFGDVREVLHRLAPGGSVAAPEELDAVRHLSRVAGRIRGYFGSRRGKYPLLWSALQHIDPLLKLVDHLDEVVDQDAHVRDSASPVLRKLRRSLVQQENALRESVLAELHRSVGQGFSTDEQPTIRNGRMVIPVRAEAKRKVQGFVHDTSSSGQTVYIEPASCLELNNEVRSLELEIEREIRRLLQECADRVRASGETLLLNQSILAQLDLRQSKAHLAVVLDAGLPATGRGENVRLVRARNPELELRAAGSAADSAREVVPLTLEMDSETAVLIISGPNAGGKSVVMKTLGVYALMLGHGIPLPVADGSAFPLFERVFADVGDEQSVEDDLSTFGSHVANLRRITEEATPASLVLIDEAGTGTDPAEGAALAQAVLEHLRDIGAKTVVTTHQAALKVFANDAAGVQNASLQFDLETLQPTYVFQAGVPGASYAFEVAERLGLDRQILVKARETAGPGQVRFERILAEYADRNRRMADQLREVEEEKTLLEKRRIEHTRKMADLDEKTDAIRARAEAEAEQLLRQTNARIERTIREIKESSADKATTKAARDKLSAFKKKVSGRAEQTRRRQKQRQRKPARSKGKSLQPGDRVMLDDGAKEAEVVEIRGNQVVILGGSVQITVDHDRLTRIGGPKSQKVMVSAVNAGSNRPALRASTRIDIRGKRVDEALPVVTRFIDDCIATGIERAEIVHGSGTGALRMAVREQLAANPDIVGYEEPTWDLGGPGVTIIRFK